MPQAGRKSGLAFWASRVVEELGRVSTGFDPDAVHDLRVALRRCRSIADGFRAVDPDPDWKRFKRYGKALFGQLGALRDVHVMQEWVNAVGEASDPTREHLLEYLRAQENQLTTDARIAVQSFDVAQWELLAQRVAQRTERIPIEGLVFQHLATERWEEARQLHRAALRNRTQIGFHRLRIGLKKFRYIVENFLPARHAKWGADLRDLQDLLGEVHDLDVLCGILGKQPALSAEHRRTWAARIQDMRAARLARYREKMVGPGSLWHTWRAELPAGAQLHDAALARVRMWGSFLDPDPEHSKLVTELALQLYDGLTQEKVLRQSDENRRILQVAGLLHDIGHSLGKRGHHKKSCHLISKIPVPLTWSEGELLAAGVVARYHCGALPRPEHKCLKRVPASARPSIVRLAGVLRLAHALDQAHDKQIRRLEVQKNDGIVVLRVDGHTTSGAALQRIAAARCLLESSCNLAVLVRASSQLT